MNNFLITAYAASNVGKKRLNNEDNYYIHHSTVDSSNDIHSDIFKGDSFVGSVCDGMGGEAAGEVASRITVNTIEKFEQKMIEDDFSDDVIAQLINNANDDVCEQITKEKKRIGTTFTLIGVKNNSVTVSNVGDSRIYQFSNGLLKQISRDHTEAQTMVDAGIVTKEESMSLKEKHRLTQHIGIFPYEMIIEPYTVRMAAKDNDRYLLCSDGLTDMLTEQEIADVFCEHLSVENTVQKLISLTLKKGGRDNVTVLICEITENLDIKNSVNEISNNNSVDAVISAFGIHDIADGKNNEVKINCNLPVMTNKSRKKEKLKNGLIAAICTMIVILSSFSVGYTVAKCKYDIASKENVVTNKNKTEQSVQKENLSIDLL